MSFPIRESVKVILLNSHNELLLLCADDPTTTTVDGKYHGRFWFPIGGKIEENESLEEAAFREIYEETGIKKEDVALGPVVWYGEFDLALSDVTTRLKQKFIVAKTEQQKVTLDNLTSGESAIIKEMEWFSLDKIQNCKDIIYPVVLSEYLPQILKGKYPKSPIAIDLTKQPTEES